MDQICEKQVEAKGYVGHEMTSDDQRWLSKFISFFLVIFLVAVVLLMIVKAHAHLADRPDLNEWAQTLKSGGGAPCCDGSDAEPIKDADWDASKDGRYRVKIDGEWSDVPPEAVVPGPNKHGTTLVWGYPIFSYEPNAKREFMVRCFMPGGGL